MDDERHCEEGQRAETSSGGPDELTDDSKSSWKRVRQSRIERRWERNFGLSQRDVGQRGSLERSCVRQEQIAQSKQLDRVGRLGKKIDKAE